MKIAYGNYIFPVNGSNWLLNEVPEMTNGIRYARRVSVTVVGRILGNGPTDIRNQIAQMQSACQVVGLNLGLFDNNNTLMELLPNAGARIPVQCISGPAFTGTRSAEYDTFREFAAVFQVVYPAGPTGIIVIELSNSISVEGGGPVYTWLPSSNGADQRQAPRPNAPQTCIQSGTAITRNLPYHAPIAGLIRPHRYEPNLSGTGLTDRITNTGIEYTRWWRYTYRDTQPF